MYRSVLPLLLAAPLWAAPQGLQFDYDPPAPGAVLNTDFTIIQTAQGPRVAVRGGVFVFRNVRIRQGVTVWGTGSNPMIWIVSGTFKVDGVLTVQGGDGAHVNTLNSANFPAKGGFGNCGGGNGGQGSPSRTNRSFFGQPGLGPFQFPNFGGQGGRINCANGACGIGSGGGGGSFATQGDPYFKVKALGNSFVQQTGKGGFGCVGVSGRRTGVLAGGAPGFTVFFDSRPDNNFFGLGVDLNRRILIPGELPFLIGGSGGGGGGDVSFSCASNDPNFVHDEKGGGGGGGGGALVIAAGGIISVGPKGRISADGGHGGGGAWAGSSNKGGGAGGGSGGMVILFTKKSIELEAHGGTYANNDYDFSITADGGVGRAQVFGSGSNRIQQKYPPPATRSQWDARPNGGFGGLGLVQLMAPWGINADQTNTYLDDNIHILRAGVRLTGTAKQSYLAWRGYPNAAGIWVDDFGKPTLIGDKEGDIRPSPVLLPAF